MKCLYSLINCTILTVDRNDRFFEDGIIVVENNKIKEIGSKEKVIPKGIIYDMEGKLVMPGLINTHTHSHSSIFKNQADDFKLMDWLKKAMWPMEKYLSADRAYAATALSCYEYIKSGITCYADQFYYAGVIAKAVQKSGLRCFLGATVFTNPSPETDDTFESAQKFIEEYIGKEEETLIYPCIGPHAPYSVEEEEWKKCVDISQKYGLIIHTHISETLDENKEIKEKTGMSPTRWLESMGVLNQNVLAAHSIHLSEEDMDLYSKYNVKVSTNPVSNLKLVSGIMPLKKMWDRGITVSIGTDGAQSNNSMDLIRDARTCALIHKQVMDDATFFTAKQSVRMCTIEGAKALNMEDKIGSLEVGKFADIIAFDSESPRLCPLHRGSLKNLYSTIAYSALGADVSDVIVNGKWVMKNNKILTFDVKEVIKEGQIASEFLVKNSKI